MDSTNDPARTSNRSLIILLVASLAFCAACSANSGEESDESLGSDPAASADATPPKLPRCEARTFDAFLMRMRGAAPLPSTTEHWYVSNNGNDAVGDGSRSNPWRSIRHAIFRTTASETEYPTIHVAPGDYTESLLIDRSLSLVRDDFERNSSARGGDVVLQQPLEGEWVVRIEGVIDVSLEDIVIDGNSVHNPGLFVSQSRVDLSRVVVKTPQGFGIVVEDSPWFRLRDATVTMDGLLLYADYAIDVRRSKGIIERVSAGHLFDHIVNVGGLGSVVAIVDSTLIGSTVHYADGVRVQSSADVLIAGSHIERPNGSKPATAGPLHNPPYAGVELATAGDESGCFVVAHNYIAGFDVGIGVNMIGNRMVAEHNLVVSNYRAQVMTMQHGRAPVIDFGGGVLGSRGSNVFVGGQWAFEHGGGYDVTARGNNWAGAADVRVLDGMDDDERGFVHHQMLH